MFEYKTENFEIIIGSVITVDDKLNEFGKDGWECFNIDKNPIYGEQYGKYMIHTSNKYFVKLKRCVSVINNEYNKKFNLPLDLKYEYLLSTWGGFYNDKNFKIHGESEGNYYFDSNESRQIYLDKLQQIEKDLNIYKLCFNKSEGYNCREFPTLHRVFKYQDKIYHQELKYDFNYSFDHCDYYLQNKWILGDFLGEGVDYNYDEVVIIQEWIEGSFTIKK